MINYIAPQAYQEQLEAAVKSIFLGQGNPLLLFVIAIYFLLFFNLFYFL